MHQSDREQHAPTAGCHLAVEQQYRQSVSCLQTLHNYLRYYTTTQHSRLIQQEKNNKERIMAYSSAPVLNKLQSNFIILNSGGIQRNLVQQKLQKSAKCFKGPLYTPLSAVHKGGTEECIDKLLLCIFAKMALLETLRLSTHCGNCQLCMQSVCNLTHSVFLHYTFKPPLLCRALLFSSLWLQVDYTRTYDILDAKFLAFKNSSTCILSIRGFCIAFRQLLKALTYSIYQVTYVFLVAAQLHCYIFIQLCSSTRVELLQLSLSCTDLSITQDSHNSFNVQTLSFLCFHTKNILSSVQWAQQR